MRVVEVAAGVICHEGRYLITRRKAGVHLAGLWEFPGGKKESGETLEECLRRELFEELGILIDLPIPFRIIQHHYPEKVVELHFFRCAIESGHPAPVDCAEVQWVLPQELDRFEFPPADRPVIQALKFESEGRNR
jgi:mutator protein MutT